MSVHWQCTDCAAYKTAKEFDQDSKEWNSFCTLRESLIHALLVTEFPEGAWAITEKNWQSVYQRLYVVEKVIGPYRKKWNDNGDRSSVYFTPEEVHSMIGLAVNAGNKTDAGFKRHIFEMLYRDSAYKIRQFFDKQAADDDEKN